MNALRDRIDVAPRVRIWQPQQWSLSPGRTRLAILHSVPPALQPSQMPVLPRPAVPPVSVEPATLACWALRPTGQLDTPEPEWTKVGYEPQWRILGWADGQRIVLWRRARRTRLQVIDVVDGCEDDLEVVGRPVACRTGRDGQLEVVVAMVGAEQPQLCLYRSSSDSYLRIGGDGGTRSLGAWDAGRGLLVVGVADAGNGLPGGVRLYRYDPAGVTPMEVDWPGGVQVVRAADCANGVIGLTGVDAAGRSVPGAYETTSGAVRWFPDQAGRSCVQVAPSGAALLATAWSGHRYIYRILDLSGGPAASLDPGRGLGTELHFSADERHLLGWHQSPVSPKALTRWALPDGEPHPLLPPAAEKAGDDLRWRHRTVPDRVGRLLPEWVFEPARDGHCGSVLFLHGGPRGQLKQEYDPVIAALVHAGWAVVGMNYPGSSGYGDQYRETGRADWGGADAVAIEDRLRALHASAEGRPVCVYGQSYGGYLALLLASRLPYLVAGVAVWAPVTDLPELAVSVTGVRQRWLADELGDLRWDARRMRQRSPTSWAATLAGTRLLIGHGSQDDRCPVDQSRLLVKLVRRHQRQSGHLEYIEDFGGHAPTSWDRWSRAVVAHFAHAELTPVPAAGACDEIR